MAEPREDVRRHVERVRRRRRDAGVAPRGREPPVRDGREVVAVDEVVRDAGMLRLLGEHLLEDAGGLQRLHDATEVAIPNNQTATSAITVPGGITVQDLDVRVLIQHLDPNHESMLAELLSRRTTMPVRQVNPNTLSANSCAWRSMASSTSVTVPYR